MVIPRKARDLPIIREDIHGILRFAENDHVIERGPETSQGDVPTIDFAVES
jgi:hypothetical protein